MMKVVLLGPYALDGKPDGGVECVMQFLSEGLSGRAVTAVPRPKAAQEIELHVISAVPGLPEPVRSLTLPGLTLHQVQHPRGERLLWHQPLVWRLRRVLQEIAPDVVHAQMAGPYADAALRSGRPAVITLHGIIFREAALALRSGSLTSLASRARWLVDARYERWIVGRAKDLIAINPYVAQEFAPLTRARFHDIPIPLARGFFEVPEEPPGAPAEKAHILCVGRVVPRKDILTLVRAFARVAATIPTAELEIVGKADADPAYTTACQEEAVRLGVGQAVRFRGSLHDQALAAAYGRANLVMLTSRQETEPAVIAESMVAGRAVVATRVGGVPFMVSEGVTGRLAEPGDTEGLAAAAIDLLVHPEQRRAMAAAAQAWAIARYQPESVVDRTLALYSHLIEHAAPSRNVPARRSNEA